MKMIKKNQKKCKERILCSFSYFMTHDCHGCKNSRLCDEFEEVEKIYDKKKIKNKNGETSKISKCTRIRK